VDLFEEQVARVWLLSDTRTATRRDVVALFNWDAKNAATIEATLAHIGLDPKQEYVAFDFWANKFLGTVKEKIALNVPADSCAILAVRPVADHPQLLSTSAHVTQGMVDVTEENWIAETKTLRGTSRVVAADPYELRIAVPEQGNWKFKKEDMLGMGSALDTRVKSVKSEPGLLRVTLEAPGTAGSTRRETAHWFVKFE
jgi:hypothetical protein